MSRPYRLALLLIPAALAVLLSALPGGAQEGSSSRYAFADTTLLRDTLGLHFDRLFPLADSLTLTPDTLRALSIRYRWTLNRLVWLSDSLRMPVDSVGVYLERESFSPLNAGRGRVTTLQYGSTYSIQQTSTEWVNSADYSLSRGSIFMRNNTNITIDRADAGNRTTIRQDRHSKTEAGWRFSPNFSVGGVADLSRFDLIDPGTVNGQSANQNEFKLSMRSRQQPTKALKTELNFSSGLLDLNSQTQVKEGWTGDLNGTIRRQSSWYTNDLSGQIAGNVARTRLPTARQGTPTSDLTNNLRGTLGVLPGAPASLNINYQLRKIRVETPTDTGTIQQIKTLTNSVDGTLRLRIDNDRYLNVNGHWGLTDNTSGQILNSQSSRKDLGLGLDGRYFIAGWSLEGRFGVSRALSEYPNRALTGGYGESLRVATVDGTISRNLSREIVIKGTGSASLNAYRYFLIGQYPNPPVNKDLYRQNYRLEALWTANERLNSAVALDVTRNVLVNIPAASTAANNEVDTYRAEWRWTYRMLPGLTASQQNSITADYTYYNFLHQNDRLALDYNILTRLNAVISPRFSLDVTHNARQQPSGTFAPLPNSTDGLDYLSRSDEQSNYTLSAKLTYTPGPFLSFNMLPGYLSNVRDGAQNGVLVPQRSSRGLNFSGGADLNFPLGAKGKLTGSINRTYRSDRSLSYTSSGVPTDQSARPVDFWNGQIQLSWEL